MLKLEALGSYKIDYTPVGWNPSPEAIHIVRPRQAIPPRISPASIING